MGPYLAKRTPNAKLLDRLKTLWPHAEVTKVRHKGTHLTNQRAGGPSTSNAINSTLTGNGYQNRGWIDSGKSKRGLF